MSSPRSLVGAFLRTQLAQHRAEWAQHSSSHPPPLVVGVQGPQGCGKSHLCILLPDELHPLKVAALSLDDLYLPHSQLSALAKAHPTNALLSGRGPPGTHDLALGTALLEQITTLNDDGQIAHFPIFDKSRQEGRGDRANETVNVTGPIDIVVLEGWMVGFSPISLPGSPTLAERYSDALAAPQKYASSHGLGYDSPFFLEHSLDSLELLQSHLANYGDALWRFIDCFVMLNPKKMAYTWDWRLEQEHNMKAKNGGIGMTDEQVKAFIARYMPGYELWLESVELPERRWSDRGLKLVVGKDRNVVSSSNF